VQESKLVGLKDDEPRAVPVLDALLPVLQAHHARGAGQGLLFQPDRPGRRAGRSGTRSRFMIPRTLHAALRGALRACKLPVEMTWYEATKHTFASQWVIGGGSMERLALILGHSSTEVTRRYAHLLPEHLGAQDRARLQVQLKIGQSMASEASAVNARKTRKRMSA
jgi:integrase